MQTHTEAMKKAPGIVPEIVFTGCTQENAAPAATPLQAQAQAGAGGKSAAKARRREVVVNGFPGLKVCSAHGGGFLPSYAPRSDNCLRVAPEMDSGVKLKKQPTEYLRSLYFDTLVFTGEALRHLAAEVGTSQLVIGTDHPIPWQAHSVDHVLKQPGLTDDEKIAILGGTAARLLKL